MAVQQLKTSFIVGARVFKNVDMTMNNIVFPDAMAQTNRLIQFDTQEVTNAVPQYTDFSNSANSVEKDGKSTHTVAPVVFKQSVSEEAGDLQLAKYGETAYSQNPLIPMDDAKMFEPVGKLMQNADVGKLYLAGQSMMFGKILKGYHSTTGVEDIVFPIPAGNFKTLTNTGAELFWTNADSNPLENILARYTSMIKKPTRVIMNDYTYSLFINNKNVFTIGNTSTGKAMNFELNKNITSGSEFFRAGTILNYGGMTLDVWVQAQTVTLQDGATVQKVILDGYLCYSSDGMASTEYAGIPQINGTKLVAIPEKERVLRDIQEEPASIDYIYITAPLTLVKDGSRFASDIVIAI